MPPLQDDPPTNPHARIGLLVRTRPVMVDERLTLRALAAVLSATHIGVALVPRHDGDPGIVSERDIIRALGNGADPDVVWSADVMTEELVTADSTETILRVALRMITEGIRHIAVTDHGEVVGVVSSRAVFAVLAEDVLGYS